MIIETIRNMAIAFLFFTSVVSGIFINNGLYEKNIPRVVLYTIILIITSLELQMLL